MKDFFPRQRYEFNGTPGKFYPDYQPASNHNAANCEFYVNKFGRRHEHNQGYSSNVLVAYICVPAQEAELLGVGMWIHYQDNDVVEECFSFGQETEMNYWTTQFTFSATGGAPSDHYKSIYDILEFAFFIDIRRPTGEIVRLWQSRSGANYTIDEVFARSYSVSLGRGSMDYADESSIIFDVKRTCSR